jgi:hypothetical protein
MTNKSQPTSVRKPHNHLAGYVAERRNPFTEGYVVIWEAEAAGIDVEARWAVTCEAHGTIVGETSVARARLSMKRPDNFCEFCVRLREAW